jgi:mitogen-activated protein kinase organizer 1
VQTYAGHAHPVLALAVAPDNARFCSGGGDRAVLVWDVASATVLRRLDGHGARVNDVAWGGDGVVVSGSFDASVRLWDTRAGGGRAMMTMAEARDGVSCVGVVGAEVWAGSVDGRVRVYDVRQGEMSVDVIGSACSVLLV